MFILLIAAIVASVMVKTSTAHPSRVRDYDATAFELPPELQSRGPTPDDDLREDNEVNHREFILKINN